MESPFRGIHFGLTSKVNSAENLFRGSHCLRENNSFRVFRGFRDFRGIHLAHCDERNHLIFIQAVQNAGREPNCCTPFVNLVTFNSNSSFVYACFVLLLFLNFAVCRFLPLYIHVCLRRWKKIEIGVDTWDVKDLRRINVSLEITYPIQPKFINQRV